MCRPPCGFDPGPTGPAVERSRPGIAHGRGPTAAVVGAALLVIAAAAVLSLSSRTAPAAAANVTITFTYWMTNTTTGTAEGTTGEGVGAGTLTAQYLAYTAGPPQRSTIVFNLKGSLQSMTIQVNGIDAAVSGTVTDGWLKGQQVTGTYTAADPCSRGVTGLCYSVTLVVSDATAATPAAATAPQAVDPGPTPPPAGEPGGSNMFGDLDFGPTSDLAVSDFATALLFSLAASVVVYVLYNVTYGERHIGAGVNRTFILGGPAITTLFIAIQFSLPLSLGLLGALSFVRFRTPVKDPAEIGFLLLLIASSICAATYNYELVIALFGLCIAALAVQAGAGRLLPGRGRRDMVITVSADDFSAVEERLLGFLRSELRGFSQESHAVSEGRASLHVNFRRGPDGDAWGRFTARLNERIAPARAEVFVG